MLTPEKLDLLTKLQPKIKTAMGEWQVGDDIYFGNFHAVIVQIKKEVGLIYARFEDSQNFLSADRIDFAYENFLRIPKPIDWQNPERGCWSMLTKENRSDNVFLNELASSPEPFMVILKKLADQEGV